MAKRKSVDPVKDYNEKREQLEQVVGSADEAAARADLDQAKGTLLARVVSVLGPRLVMKDAERAIDLAGGGISLNEALSGKMVDFAYDDSRAGNEAAEHLSTITEIAEHDHELAAQIMKKIFTPKISTTVIDNKEKEKVAQTALVHLEAGDKNALVQYLSGTGINHSHALNALVSLEPGAGRDIMENLPNELQTSFLVGQLTIDDRRAIGLLGPRKLADQVLAQMENDEHPQEGFSDRGNMTAAILLDQILQEKTELGNNQLLEGMIVLLMIGKENLQLILKYKAERTAQGQRRKGRAGDPEETVAAQRRIREYWQDNKNYATEAREHHRAMRAEQPTNIPSMSATTATQTLDVLTADTDLDAL